MSELLRFPLGEPGADAAELPYRLELWDDAGHEVRKLLALSSTPGVGYAVYYAAIREYFGRRVTLTCGERVLAASGAPR